MPLNERQIMFENHGERLYGFLHLPPGVGPHPAIALLHGFGGNHIEPHALFPKAARALAGAGTGVLRFDFRGSGDSEGEFGEMTIEGEVSDAHAGLAFLAAQPEVDASRLGLAGLSLGGLIAACTAAARGDVRAVVLWAPVAHLGELFAASSSAEHLSQLESRGYADGGGLAIGNALAQQAMLVDPVSALTQYDGPVLIIHGTADATVPVAHTRRYKLALGNRAELRMIDGADHVFSSLEWERSVIQATVEWFQTHLGPA